MNKISKIIFWSSIVFLGLSIFFSIVRNALGLEFASDDIKSAYKEFIFFTVPTSILLTLFGTIKPNDNLSIKTSKIVLTLSLAFIPIIFMYLSIFSDMCSYTDVKTVYRHKHHPNTKIVIREFGCGATDSSPPGIRVHRVRYFTKYFIRTSRIDTNHIDKNQWIKIP